MRIGLGVLSLVIGIILAFIACISIYEGIDRAFTESLLGGLFGVMASIFICTSLILFTQQENGKCVK